MSLKLNRLIGFGVQQPVGSGYMRDILNDLGLTGSFQLGLDVADLQSYDGASQTWTDFIGANDFFRGTTNGVDATDPSFVGVAGQADQNTYFSHDGGDYFTESATHSFADNWHKDNGKFSIVALSYIVSGASHGIFSNARTSGDTGITLFKASSGSSDEIRLSTTITDVPAAQTIAIGLPALNAWNYIGISCDESNGIYHAQLNGTKTSGAFSPSTSVNANLDPLRISSFGPAGSAVAINGYRLAILCAGSVAIGAEALDNIQKKLKARRIPLMAA